ncbi:MAG: hypothetical protein M0Z99_07350 [Betaproteobacteria bacterium]|nr:hypothetical protein [Betaproteobacteria bacterium]
MVSRELDPVEKKPLFHFYPGFTAYSIGTVGCNLRCTFCQNWQISQWAKTHLPEEIVEAPLRELAQVLDAANVDLKFFRDKSYRHISRARLEPILQAIRLYCELGVWVEVTTLVIPGVNDSDEELAGGRLRRGCGAYLPDCFCFFYCQSA